ncbi:MAG: UdgX family uracil-DNA binding protein [Actinomycetota bacterium]
MAMVPVDPDLDELRSTAAACTACPLFRDATQTVFGKGLIGSKVMLVGEQPGDKEDRAGEPFVGPAGRLLDEALEAAGIDRDSAYVTNVVKHFKFEQRGKRRVHKKPNTSEIGACRPWLDAEIEVVQPKALVCLGATAAQALLGRSFRVTRHRGEFVESDLAPLVTATIHPSAILRAADERETEMRGLIDDLTRVRRALAKV